MNSNGEEERKLLGLGIALGIGIGTILGVLFDNIPLGVALGIAVGTIFGMVLNKQAKRDE